MNVLQGFRKVIQYVNAHVETARFFLPKKNVSWLFKFLNFISCDRLRLAVAVVSHQIHELREDYDMFMGFEYHTVKEYQGFMKRLGKRIDWTERRLNRLWDL